jgi:adenine deaminase
VSIEMRRMLALLLALSFLSVMPLVYVRAQRTSGASGNRSNQMPGAQPAETLIRNATILTVSHGTLENADILIRNGKITAVGQNLKASANARVIDATGKYGSHT